MRKLALALCCSLAISCSMPRSVKEGGPVSGQLINPTAKVLVLGISDGQEQGQASVAGSGDGMVAAVRKVLMARKVPLSITEATTLASGLAEAEKGGFDYLLKGKITLWQDNATAWSGNGDKLSLSVEMYDVKTRELAAAASHDRVATGATLVAGTPHRFMDEVAEGTLSQIYGWPVPK